MQRYDPLKAPDPEEWLALDEQERMELVQDYHRRMRIRLPNAKLHAVAHAIVEALNTARNGVRHPECDARITCARDALFPHVAGRHHLEMTGLRHRRELARQLLNQPIRECLIGCIVPNVGERQHGQ